MVLCRKFLTQLKKTPSTSEASANLHSSLTQYINEIVGLLLMLSCVWTFFSFSEFAIEFSIARLSLGLLCVLVGYSLRKSSNASLLPISILSVLAFAYLNFEASMVSEFQVSIVAQASFLFAFVSLSSPFSRKQLFIFLGASLLSAFAIWFLADSFAYEKFMDSGVFLILLSFVIGTLASEFSRNERLLAHSAEVAKTKALADLESLSEKVKEIEEESKTIEQRDNRVLRVAVHDINNRIASLKNLSKLFELKFSKMQEESLIKYNEKLDEIANELSVFADNLVTPVKSKDFPEIKVHPDYLELRPMIEYLVDELRFKASHKNVGLNLIQTNKELHLYVDKTYLKVVLRNLINYAIKFSQNNNQVIVSSSVRFGKVYIEVMDKSRGIEKETLERMFSFLPDKIEDKMEDTTKGIGLSVAKYLTEKMGGRIDFESSVELGLHFSVVFDAVTLPPELADKKKADLNFN